ncbi:hypothetical protein COO60DRAFT_1548609 [Scenedesmus sp. NREL 46B-D3]|nr:hypothetical protein COO60DRAFT_1548609 [Scenedesmus sp. NREL 46B-D3]
MWLSAAFCFTRSRVGPVGGFLCQILAVGGWSPVLTCNHFYYLGVCSSQQASARGSAGVLPNNSSTPLCSAYVDAEHISCNLHCLQPSLSCVSGWMSWHCRAQLVQETLLASCKSAGDCRQWWIMHVHAQQPHHMRVLVLVLVIYCVFRWSAWRKLVFGRASVQ